MQRKRRTRTILLLLAGMLLMTAPAVSEEMVIPSGTTEIAEEAFAGCGAIRSVVIPDSVTVIGENAFLDCGEALLIRAGAGSAAVEYAQANRIDYMAGTEYRALIIAQTYPRTYMELTGPANDKTAVSQCLRNLCTTPFSVTIEENLSPEGIISAIGSCFAAADGNDVSLLYYSGHGETDGSLLGADTLSRLAPQRLRAALDSIPGRKVIIVDACYSGQLIAEEQEKGGTLRAASSSDPADAAENGAAGFVSAFQAAFRTRLRGALNSDLYFVVTAASEKEASMEGDVDPGTGKLDMGYFTYGFCKGCGWNSPLSQTCGLMADRNGDEAVSIQEIYAYARSVAAGYNPRQTAEVWPADCRWFAPFRR